MKALPRPTPARVVSILRWILRRAVPAQIQAGTEGTHVRVIADKVKDPAARIDNFRIEIETPVDLPDQTGPA